ncbi:MAG: hypothetical protein WDN04_04310 [Rhodospirillales bacterium]
MRPTLLLCLAALLIAAWYLPARPADPPGGLPGEKFSSLSFTPYRTGQSPLTGHFPTAAQVDADMALVARVTGAVRSYATHEGDFDTAALAQKHGVKLWQGIWLSGNRADNDREIARGIALANQYPDTIVRLIVGNEVLLRRDLPPSELIADLDRVKHAVHQPVAFADVWEFWKQFPEVAAHVDIILIHLLPYWEDVPTGIDRAVAHAGEIYRQMRALFPGKTIAIGETGWPSHGRQRGDAIPSRINETKFLRDFLALSRAEHFDYNFIEAFDQVWKYHSEGIVGANWGIYDAERQLKIPLTGPVSNDPGWPTHAAISVIAGLCLSLLGLWQGRAQPPSRRNALCVAGMALGGALGYAAAEIFATLYDIHLELAGAVNLFAQTALAVLAMLRLSGAVAAAPRPHRRRRNNRGTRATHPPAPAETARRIRGSLLCLRLGRRGHANAAVLRQPLPRIPAQHVRGAANGNDRPPARRRPAPPRRPARGTRRRRRPGPRRPRLSRPGRPPQHPVPPLEHRRRRARRPAAAARVGGDSERKAKGSAP